MAKNLITVAPFLLFGITMLSSCNSQAPGDVVYVDVLKTGLQWIIQNDDPESYNVPGQTPGVAIAKSKINFRKNSCFAAS